ncbi:MAG: PKD domain-containing protein [Bacteroidetes bacterium]|jgi:PKD repeat protein|nr:PKD domain-containing protein [Bacteroidota bacterium]MBT6687937.1 PKD domain-containing protein [Bacteroidota bacterium]MBT7143276.1 PKD domain-containing protein [Bacteroidota bacterium]MBT7490257.1 PKD domain-containing protein [Bacteroidota bacterium]
MRKKLIIIVLTILLGSFTNNLEAQAWLENSSKTESTEGISDLNFFEIQKAFNQYWENKPYEKGKGWKQFKRWENFVEQRVSTDGKINNSIFWSEYQKKINKTKNKASVANWTAMGPFDTPLSMDNSYKTGSGRVNCVAFHPTNQDIMWIGAPAGGLWKTTDGGASWITTTDDLPSIGVSDIAVDPNNPDIIYIATGDGDAGDTYSVGILKSLDGGLSWQTIGLNFFIYEEIIVRRLLINPSNSNILIAASNDGIYKTIDAGQSWTNVQTGHFKDLEFMPNNPTIIYATKYGGFGGGKIYRSTNSGDSFTELNTGVSSNDVNRIELAVTPANSNLVYALFSDANNDGFYATYKSSDAGDNWTQTFSGSNMNLLGWSENGNDVGGQGWYDLSLAVSPTNENIVFVGGVNIWKSVNGGSSWNCNGHWYGAAGIEYVHADQHVLAYNVNTGVLFSGNDGGFYKTQNDGSSWTDISDGLEILQIYRIGSSATNAGIVVGGTQDNGTMKINSGQWNNILGGDGMECMIDFNNPNIIYSTYYYGSLHKSTNGGFTFNDISPASNGAWVTPYAMHPTNSNTLYAGYSNVYKTTNGGNSWDQISSNLTGGTDLQSLAIAKSNPDYIYTATYDNIYKTTNGGTNWENITSGLPSNPSIKYIAISSTDPNKLWVTFSGFYTSYKVYMSEDGGNIWQNFSDSLPNVPANCIVYEDDSNDALYVGTDIGVYYRNDSIPYWIAFDDGLPNVVVYELEIQYSEKKIRAGTFGRGLWESDLYSEPMAPISNFQFTNTSDCNGIVSFEDISAGLPETWEWIFGDGSSSFEQNPIHIYNDTGIFVVQLITENSLGTDTNFLEISISLNSDLPVVSGDERCGEGSLLLQADASGQINWYENEIGGNSLDTGDFFQTPIITNSTTFFAENEIGGAQFYGGKFDNSGGGGYYSGNNPWGLVFDCLEASEIVSVKVYFDPSESAGNREIMLLDENNSIVQSASVFVPQGESRINLGFEVQPGSNYKLVGQSSPNMYRNNNGGIAYPFNISNLITITQSSLDLSGYDPIDYYYFFYDWEVKEISCRSNRVPVLATINPNPTADFSYITDNLNVQFTNNSPNANSYYWDFGDGNFSSEANPVHNYSSNGIFEITYIASSQNCSDTITQTIDLTYSTVEFSFIEKLKILPNPNSGVFIIDFSIAQEENIKLEIVNLAGQSVYSEELTNFSGKYSKEIHLSDIAKGIYQIQISSKDKIINRKFSVE